MDNIDWFGGRRLEEALSQILGSLAQAGQGRHAGGAQTSLRLRMCNVKKRALDMSRRK